MKIAGMIAEFNPFHRGHACLAREARRITGADYVVAAMSGDFVQRGEPALWDKGTRARMALACGIDLVCELPALFAVSAAGDFAACGTALLDGLGADFLCFGSECGDLAPLGEIADMLADEPPAFSQVLKERLKAGDPFPKARQEALSRCLPPSPRQDMDARAEGAAAAAPSWTAARILSSPNNVLGVEYLRALKEQKSGMRPVTVRRAGQDYHDTSPRPGVFASAAALRAEAARLTPLDPLSSVFFSGQLPPAARAAAQAAKPVCVFPDDLSLLLNARILEALKTPEALRDICGFTPQLAARLLKTALFPLSFTGQADRLKTKAYTRSRAGRALLNLVLGFTKEEAESGRALGFAPYCRILGFRREAAPLLTELKKRSRLPLVTRPAKAGAVLTEDASALFQLDLKAAHLYRLLCLEKGRLLPDEYTGKIIIL